MPKPKTPVALIPPILRKAQSLAEQAWPGCPVGIELMTVEDVATPVAVALVHGQPGAPVECRSSSSAAAIAGLEACLAATAKGRKR